MTYKLGTNVEVGNKVLTKNGWEKIASKFDDMIVTDKGTEIKFGEEIYGWKLK